MSLNNYLIKFMGNWLLNEQYNIDMLQGSSMEIVTPMVSYNNNFFVASATPDLGVPPSEDSNWQSIGAVNLFDAIVDPVVTNGAGEGFIPGSLWMNTATQSAFMCVDNTIGAAVWKQITLV
jgi:hypothetical protein